MNTIYAVALLAGIGLIDELRPAPAEDVKETYHKE